MTITGQITDAIRDGKHNQFDIAQTLGVSHRDVGLLATLDAMTRAGMVVREDTGGRFCDDTPIYRYDLPAES